MPIRAAGWKKDKRDERDYLVRKAVYLLPESVNLVAIMPEVRDQGNLGSCVGFGIGGNFAGTARQIGATKEWFSPTWFYNGARLLEGSLAWDDGAYPRDALEFGRDHGCLLEHFRPYRAVLDKTSPLTWRYEGIPVTEESEKWPVASYARCVDGIEGIKAALAAGHLVSIGAPWFSAWDEPDKEGILPEAYGFVAGGHAFLCYGYDDVRKVLACQNSWGTSWGKAGRFSIRYSAVEAWKQNGGYDAHTVTVDWTGQPEPEPDPEPAKKKFPWWVLVLVAAAIAVAALLI